MNQLLVQQGHEMIIIRSAELELSPMIDWLTVYQTMLEYLSIYMIVFCFFLFNISINQTYLGL